MRVSELSLYLSFSQDQSYTPRQIAVKVGSSFHAQHEICQMELDCPEGWVHIPLGSADRPFVWATSVQIAIHSNHQEGRDSHVRQIKFRDDGIAYTTMTFAQQARLR
ncbi:putative anaphase-promoting complex subunit 10 [Paratrimastix pyriformis]|uniref:Anaphase-promoting complex subunit 10 n=1 Tax=Paratrimastix pyriformis TaxID=342808 RepID=A0ABQ8UQR3_9EUKA|nr:putative anaphase-promoting complex subunit 10 [Paratrimastix pyriformis]